MIKIAACVIAFCFVLGMPAQDPLFFNTSQSLVYLNPSYAGNNGLIRMQACYRSQWAGSTQPYITAAGSVDGYIKPIRAGVALSYLHDDQVKGTLKTDLLSIAYAQKLFFLNKKLNISPSVSLGYFRKELDKSKITFGDQIDPRRGFVWGTSEAVPSQSKSNFIISTGLLLQFKNLYTGAYLFNVNQPNEGLLGDSKLPMRFSFHAAYNQRISNNSILHFFGRYEQQQNFYTYRASVTALLFKHLIIGGGYFHSRTPTATIGYRNNYITLQADYGRTMGLLSSATANTWEVSLSINIRKNADQKKLTDFENGAVYPMSIE